MTLLTSVASYLIVGAVVGAIAGSLAKDVKVMAGGGALGAILGTTVYFLVRLAAWTS